jgi:hypothetical protein
MPDIVPDYTRRFRFAVAPATTGAIVLPLKSVI